MRYDQGGYDPYTPPTPYTPPAGDTFSPPVGTASAPPVTPVETPPEVQTMSGYTPDYAGLIQSDPSYIAAQAASGQAEGTAAARRRAAMRAALVRFGAVPAGFQDQYGDVDQATRDAAAGNQNSVIAGLANRYAQSVDQFRRGLSARGGLQSSELDYGSDQLARGYSQQQYDASNALTDEVNRGVNEYVGVLGQNAQNMSSAIGTAEGNVYANPAYRPSDPQFADYDAGTSATFGKPVYRDGTGNLYDASGNPFNPPEPTTPQATPDDWQATSGTTSGYSPGVASEDLAYLYGGV